MIVGHLLFSRLVLTGVRAVGLAPMSVKPGRQSSGIGSALVREGLDLLRKRGEQAVFVPGHRGYCPPFGFQNDLAARFESSCAGESFFALELEAGVFDGRPGAVSFAVAFSAFE